MTARHPAVAAPVKHVFVDYENMHELDLKLLGTEGVHLTLLLGPTQTKLDAALVEGLLEHAAAVQLVRLTSAGRNALDFALAYYLGRAVASDPAGRFLIVSKDKGYDPLVEHLRSRSLNVWREADWGAPAVPAVPKPPPAAPAQPAAQPERKPGPAPRPGTILDDWEGRVLEFLRRATTTRPSTRKKLASWISAHLGNKPSEAEVVDLIERLGQAGHLFMDTKGKVTYHLDPA
jgi:hypothetical protein